MAVPSLPAVAELESTVAFADFAQANISDEYLQHHCGVEDLSLVKRLEITVDSEEQTVESLGSQLPNLSELKFVNSLVHSIRDLGTQLRNLRVLWLNRSGLRELAGIVALPRIDELYLSFNEITDLAPLSYNDTIQVLDLEGNGVSASELEYLETVTQLRELTLCGNPVARMGSYVRDVLAVLPELAMLDDELAEEKKEEKEDPSPSLGEASTDADHTDVIGSSEPDEDQLVLEGLKKGVYQRRQLRQSSTARPATAAPIPWGGPASAPSSFRPQTAAEEDRLLPDSELTLGSETGLAGNPLNVVRHRRRTCPQDKEGIRALLERFATLSQTCLSEEELRRRAEADRPRTSMAGAGVRISRGRPVTAVQLGADEPLRRGQGDVPAPVMVGKAETFVLE